jgi:hypothetical protein
MTTENHSRQELGIGGWTTSSRSARTTNWQRAAHGRGNPERHRCVKIVTADESEVQRLQDFVLDARTAFGQEAMYFEAVRVHFKLI